MKKLLFALLSILVIAGLVIGGCDGTAEPTNGDGNGDGNGGEPPPQVLKIGNLLTLSQFTGYEVQKWFDVFVEEINNDGGWLIGGERYLIEYTAYDCGFYDPAKTRTAVEKAVLDDGVKFLINNSGDIAEVTLTVTEPNGVLTFGGGLSDAVLDPSVQYTWRCPGVFFGAGLMYVQYNDMVARGAETAITVKDDTDLGQFGAFLCQTDMMMAGLEVLPAVFFAPDTTDFGPIATKIVSYDPDLVDLNFCAYNVQVAQALNDIGYEGFVITSEMTPATLNDLITRVGAEYIEGWESTYFDPRGTATDPRILALIDAYTEKYGEFVPDGTFYAGGWFVFEDAVNATQSLDLEVLKAYLDNSPPPVQTLCGYMQLFARPDLGNYRTVDSAAGHWIGIVEDGELVPRDVVSVKDQYLISIATYGLADLYRAYWDEYGYPTFPDEPSKFDFDNLP